MPRRAPLFRPGGQPTVKERKAQADRNRGTSTQRGYDAVWRRLRLMHLRANPLCVFCRAKGLTVLATVGDHIVAIEDDPSRRLDPENIQSLCKPCHDGERQRQQAAARR